MPQRPPPARDAAGRRSPSTVAELVIQMRASVLLVASFTMLAPYALRAEPSLLASQTSPTAAESHPSVPTDFRWDASNSSTLFAEWVALFWGRDQSRFIGPVAHPG